jgi:hypothetical protein
MSALSSSISHLAAFGDRSRSPRMAAPRDPYPDDTLRERPQGARHLPPA